MKELKIETQIEQALLLQDINFVLMPVISGQRPKLTVTHVTGIEISVYRINDNQIRIDVVQK